MPNSKFIIFFLFATFPQIYSQEAKLKINELEYYEIPSLNIMMFSDFYPEGHQGGLSIVQFGNRIAANGDIRLEPTPGQWSPVPKLGKRIVDKENGIISAELWYPDSTKDKKGFNPVNYPDLQFKYFVRTEAIGDQIKLTVDLEKPLPKEWVGKVGFNLELFPGIYFGEHFIIDKTTGIFPQQPNGPFNFDGNDNLQIDKMAEGIELLIAPGINEKQLKIKSDKNKIQLFDGRGLHNNGWFIIRSVIAPNETENVIEWLITPSYDLNWKYKPVIQISQVGYHPNQVKFAVVELDKQTENTENIQLIKVDIDGEKVIKQVEKPNIWGNFLRYKYLRFDFSDVKEEGIYIIKYGNVSSNRFEIKHDVFSKYIWQPTIEYFLPVQMCHMKIIEKYRTWHGLCHMDDARMAPINLNHFDGYLQGNSTLTEFHSGENVPGLNIGGWHDAGDYDLRVESQSETVYGLALIYELFKSNIDETTIDQTTRTVEIHKPDGKPDILQQIEHGVLSIIGGYESLGRLYRGIICPTLQQYVLLGDGSTMTDNIKYAEDKNDPILNLPLKEDDRWIFTEENPYRELQVAQHLAAASRALKDYNSELSKKCIKIAETLFDVNKDFKPEFKINAAAEIFLTTQNKKYSDFIFSNSNIVANGLGAYGMVLGRFVKASNNYEFNEKIKISVKKSFDQVVEMQKQNPYGVPYQPYIWGAGWGIQEFGVNLLMMHIGFPEIIDNEYVFNALNFILGCHPGENTASFISGVGSKSLIVAYGVNRADWSYIPGGSASGTALIRPDLPELKTWPFFWQQTEYVMGGGTTDFIMLAMAADNLLNKN
ncbi:MAG: glycoside hydrolase family 9 protein [Ignavibacteriae bacterium]|nr:glycoside hydrolase family 9 protein [Ignavibacteriota bacterium]